MRVRETRNEKRVRSKFQIQNSKKYMNKNYVSFKHPSQRVVVLADAQNLYHSAKHLHRATVNFKALLDAAVSDRQLARALAYVVKSSIQEEATFFSALDKSGWEVHSKDLQIFADGSKKADWDVGLAIDAITLAEKVDVVVVLSGDGDFVPLIQYLRYAKGCLVEVMAFGGTASKNLIEAADGFIDISDNSNFLFKKTRSLRRR